MNDTAIEVPQPSAPFPPRDALPVAAGLDLVLVNSDWMIASLGGFCCYASGCEFTLSIRLRSDRAPILLQTDTFDTDSAERRVDLKTRIGADHSSEVRLVGGHHDTVQAEQQYWLSPLPHGSSLEFALEWRAAGVVTSWRTLPAAVLRDAAMHSPRVGG
jgi:hypothetical protein